MSFFRYKRDGLAFSLIKIHDALLRDAVAQYEKGKDIRSGINQARKAVKKALRVAKKKQINPGLKIGKAREELERLQEEVEYTRKALLAVTSNLDNALTRIKKERIEEPLALIDSAHELFRNKEIEKGIEMLKESQVELKKKVLVESRTALFGGTSNQVTEVKDEIVEFREKRGKSKK